MNVAFDPWIPVVTVTGERTLASLCSVLTEGDKYADLAVRPHERVSLMRLFLCVAHAALDGPKDYDEWEQVPKKLPDAAWNYLKEWKDSFELFHPTKPWLQFATIGKEESAVSALDDIADWTPVSKLNFTLATGNSSTLFDHDGMNECRSTATEEMILSMISCQCFSPGGLISQVYWAGKKTSKSSKDGPCVPASMVHTSIRGKNLLETVCLNLVTYEDLARHYPNCPQGKPVWELMPTSLADGTLIQNATSTYVGRLVPLTRLIRLHRDGEKMLFGDGLQYPSFADGFPPEATATVVVRKSNKEETHALLSYRTTKAFWRELGALVVKRRTGEPGGPLTLNSLQDAEACDLIVSALARDKASILDTAESVFHVPAQLRKTVGIEVYETEVHKAESTARRLGWAVEDYRMEIDGGWEGRLKGAGPKSGELKAKLHSIATTHYWTSIEKNLSLLMDHIEAIGTNEAMPTREVWHKMLFATACDAYRVACGHETPRQIRAFAKGWQKLTAKKEEAMTTETKEVVA
jgi:CRISPR system Cascade subunit CasA